MLDANANAGRIRMSAFEPFGDHDRTVPPSGAANGDVR
jgi:hypothetical protein